MPLAIYNTKQYDVHLLCLLYKTMSTSGLHSPERWKGYTHQRETTGSSNDSLELHPFSNRNFSQREQILSFMSSSYSMEKKYFDHFKWPPLNVTFITYMRNLHNGYCANVPRKDLKNITRFLRRFGEGSFIKCVLVSLFEIKNNWNNPS